MNQRIEPTKKFWRAVKYRDVAVPGILALLVAFQFLLIYRYRDVVIKNDANIRQLQAVARSQEENAFPALKKQLDDLTAENAALKNLVEDLARNQDADRA